MEAHSAKTVMILLNIIIFLGGATCIVSGLLLRFDSSFLSSDVITLLNKIDYKNLPIGVALEALTYISMGFGGLVVILSVIGLVGVWKGIKGCLYLYLTMIVFALILEAALIGIWIAVRGRNNQWLRGQLLIQLAPYAGPTSTDEVSQGWNTMFMEAHCCGVNDQFKDGGTNSDFTEIPTTWTSGTDKVPASCCQGVDSDNVANYVNSATCTTTPKNFYSNGCYDTIRDDLNAYSLITICACAAIALAEVIAFVAACVIVSGRRSKVSPFSTPTAMTPESGTRPPPYVAINKFLQNKNRKKRIDDGYH